MTGVDHLGHCRRELRRFEELLDGDLDAPVKHCGSWDLYRLADHLGRQNLWVTAGITEGHGDARPPHAPRGQAELTAWFRSTSDTLLAALATDPTAAAWTIYPPETVGFWRRRRAHETLIHRWDAEHALGIPSEFDDALAADGIDEVFDTMLPRQISLGRLDSPSATISLDSDSYRAQWGTGVPVATIGGPLSQLLLLLWGRAELNDAGLTVSGDPAVAAEFLALELVP